MYSNLVGISYMCTTVNHLSYICPWGIKVTQANNFTSVFPVDKKDEPEDESKGETKDESAAEPDKVFITLRYL